MIALPPLTLGNAAALVCGTLSVLFLVNGTRYGHIDEVLIGVFLLIAGWVILA